MISALEVICVLLFSSTLEQNEIEILFGLEAQVEGIFIELSISLD